MIQPIMPDSAAKLLDQLNIVENERDFSFVSEEYAIAAGTKIEAPEGVFPRLEVQKEVA